ncbi:hypothetical protein [Haloarchaeobius sp. DFWS5]|uniref:hypothetical protein n=1 Tax=Haloarchaeobius sp. DFWS5 TaxID=3446114 RepID=UPI003EB709B3
MRLLRRITGIFGSEETAEATTGTAGHPGTTDTGEGTATTAATTSPKTPGQREASADDDRTETSASEAATDDDAAAATDRVEDEPDPRDRVDVFREQATACVERWPAYDLDYTLESLARLDDLVDDLEASGADQELVLALGSYFGETLLNNGDGEWEKPAGGNWAVVLDGGETDVTLNVFQLAAGAFRGTSGFAATYRAVEQRL